ncbi:creatininase family protein (plasmid) [Haloferax sp. S1W]|uniref:creatininase family protein n=1 Tax=Haloferax sp. S1W TaxID=3377110 RepID=UPI0037C8FFB0
MSDDAPAPVWLHELTWPAVESYLESEPTPTVLVPVGSTEQHGPHLPLGVDGFQARSLAEEIAVATDVLTAPPLWYGDADHHLGFPGTISLSTDTVVSVLSDIYDSLANHGFVNIITVNGHRIANLTAIRIAMDRANRTHPDASFAAIDPLRIGIDAHRRLRDGDSEDGMHGGEFETSFMLANHPELVREAEFTREVTETEPYQSDDLVSLTDSVIRPHGRRTPEDGSLGHVGDPTNASAEKGDELWAELVANAADFIDSLR